MFIPIVLVLALSTIARVSTAAGRVHRDFHVARYDILPRSQLRRSTHAWTNDALALAPSMVTLTPTVVVHANKVSLVTPTDTRARAPPLPFTFLFFRTAYLCCPWGGVVNDIIDITGFPATFAGFSK